MEEILSKSTNARRRGLAVVATTALVAGASFAGAGAAFAAAPGLTADSAPNVTQGASNQAAGDLTYGFPNVFTTNATVEFDVDSAARRTTAPRRRGIDEAIEFADTPAVTITHDNAADTGRIPTFTTTLGSSTHRVRDRGHPGPGHCHAHPAEQRWRQRRDQLDINVSSIDYNVGSAHRHRRRRRRPRPPTGIVRRCSLTRTQRRRREQELHVHPASVGSAELGQQQARQGDLHRVDRRFLLPGLRGLHRPSC